MSYSIESMFVGLVVAAAFIVPASAETLNFKAELSSASEVPPNTSHAKGEVSAVYDTGSKILHWRGNYSDLSGPVTAGHFHGPAGVGKNAGVAIPIFSGAGAQNPFEGSATLTDAQAQGLVSGLWYVNIHTAAHKSGEVRGQIIKTGN